MKNHFRDLRNSIGINGCALKMIAKEISDKKKSDGLDFDRPEAGFDF